MSGNRQARRLQDFSPATGSGTEIASTAAVAPVAGTSVPDSADSADHAHPAHNNPRQATRLQHRAVPAIRGVSLLLAGWLTVAALPAGADSIDEYQKARRDKVMRELKLEKGRTDPQTFLGNVQPGGQQELIPIYKGSYGSANDPRDRFVLLAYDTKLIEARVDETLPGGWQVIEIGKTYAKIQKGDVVRFLDVKLPSTYPGGLTPSIFKPIN